MGTVNSNFNKASFRRGIRGYRKMFASLHLEENELKKLWVEFGKIDTDNGGTVRCCTMTERFQSSSWLCVVISLLFACVCVCFFFRVQGRHMVRPLENCRDTTSSSSYAARHLAFDTYGDAVPAPTKSAVVAGHKDSSTVVTPKARNIDAMACHTRTHLICARNYRERNLEQP